MKWFHDYKSPPKYVYNQTICGTCLDASVAICRIGGTDRTTFWCTNCQRMEDGDEYLRQGMNTCTSTSASTSASSSTDPSSSTPSASASLPERTIMASNSISHTTTSSSSSISKKCKVCPTHGPSHIILRRCKKRGTVNEDRIFYTCTAKDKDSCSSSNFNSSSGTSRTRTRTRNNKKKKTCHYFAWADTSFPKCHCGKRVTMRVSKTEQSGGKWFFFCSNRKRKGSGSNGCGCGYFQWVDPQ
eukprot:CAMPEP_0204635466 /NCGR_PEP_ID=MMETSP0717-20131115/31500_1 /ASSEMBLY_ACC=CAM_ASM_000666 /TAXON_ID=230516 /ORGANISM="Chaetoceros curvisetus" /LENGTH=242 /DNA_ID=CAMNT_0051654213 /DNA_START=80 /DNA_END=805 /DNA_ORIENTATION=+